MGSTQVIHKSIYSLTIAIFERRYVQTNGKINILAKVALINV